MKVTRRLLKEFLEDLSKSDLQALQSTLNTEEINGATIPKSKLEEMDALGTANVLISYHGTNSLKALCDALCHIPRNDLLQEIHNKIAYEEQKTENQKDEMDGSSAKKRKLQDLPSYNGKYSLSDMEDYASENQDQLIRQLQRYLEPAAFETLAGSTLKNSFSFTNPLLNIAEPSQIGAQRDGITRGKAEEENEWLKQVLRQQDRVMEMLTEQNRLLMNQMDKQDKEEDWRKPRDIECNKGGNNQCGNTFPVKMQKMTEGDDIETYLNIFEQTAVAAKCPKEQWALILIPCLTGELQSIVDELGPEEAIQYNKVKQTILLTFNISKEAYRKKFRDLKLQTGIHARLLAQRMKSNVIKWLQPGICTFEDAIEQIVIEQLLTTASTSVNNWVRKNQPKNLEEVIRLLENYYQNSDISLGSCETCVVEKQQDKMAAPSIKEGMCSFSDPSNERPCKEIVEANRDRGPWTEDYQPRTTHLAVCVCEYGREEKRIVGPSAAEEENKKELEVEERLGRLFFEEEDNKESQKKELDEKGQSNVIKEGFMAVVREAMTWELLKMELKDVTKDVKNKGTQTEDEIEIEKEVIDVGIQGEEWRCQGRHMWVQANIELKKETGNKGTQAGGVDDRFAVGRLWHVGIQVKMDKEKVGKDVGTQVERKLNRVLFKEIGVQTVMHEMEWGLRRGVGRERATQTIERITVVLEKGIQTGDSTATRRELGLPLPTPVGPPVCTSGTATQARDFQSASHQANPPGWIPGWGWERPPQVQHHCYGSWCGGPLIAQASAPRK